MTLPTETLPLTDDQKREFCLMISIGCDRETASKYVGCTSRLLRDTLNQDPQFAKQLARAEATPEFSHMRNLHNAAKDEKNWRVSVWWLERCAPERYARRSPDVISAAQLKKTIKELAEAIAGEIADPRDRQRLLKRLTDIVQAIENDEPLSPSDQDHELPAS